MANPKIAEAGIATRFKAGDPQRPRGGRPKGARDRLSAKFLNDLAELWEEQGAKVLQELREKDPRALAQIAASLQTKEVEISRPLDDVSDDELDELIALRRAQLEAEKQQVN